MTKPAAALPPSDPPPDHPSEIEAAAAAGTLRALIARRYRDGDDERRDFDNALVNLHNRGSIDAVAVLAELGRSGGQENDFFDIQLVFKDVLPRMMAEIAVVMDAVCGLVRAGEGDTFAGVLVDPFRQFCAVQPGRADEALRLIREDAPRYALLYPAVLAAGLEEDRAGWIARAIDVLKTEEMVFLRHVVFALTRPELAADEDARAAALSALKARLVGLADDDVLASAVRAIFALDPVVQGARGSGLLLDDVLAAGGDATLHAAIECLWLNGRTAPPAVAAVVFRHGERIKPAHKGTLHRADMALYASLGEPCENEALAFLERYLVANVGSVEPEAFQHSLRKIPNQHPALFGRLLVKWFLSGERALCDSARWMVTNSVGEAAPMPVDAIAGVALESGERIFVARKAVGWLFFQPKAAAEVVLAVMRDADSKSSKIIEDHLFDPLLINYAGPLEPFLREAGKSAPASVKRRINSALKRWRAHIDAVKAAGAIKELWPSERERAITRQRFADESAAAMREAEANSVLLSAVSKSVVLYGRASIHSIRGPDGKNRRAVTRLQSHSFTIDVPSEDMVDPFGLDYKLRFMRVEKIRR
ncbi:MAG TPA: hypothetical protein PK585_10300 [Amphiplicatus sp.]|nr:hypothetical protein [Amphiplicatus sp.]MCB9956152.1 hypothetical protein [Caulobacterales bacterium]HOP20462.1 hypothetical protein [Amphiplicatus sp.]